MVYLQPLWHNQPAKLSNSVKKTQNKGYYAVEDHSRSFKLIEVGNNRNPLWTIYYWIIATDIQSRTVSELSQLIFLLFKFWILYVFEPPFEGGRGGSGITYDVHLGLIGKHVVDFVLLLNELFSLGVTAKAQQSKIDRKSAMSLDPTRPKISGRRGRPPTNHSSSQKTRLNDLSYGIKIWTDLSFVLLQSRRLTDGRTDRQNSHRQTASALHAAR